VGARTTDLDALGATFDRIEEGNERARRRARSSAPAPARTTPRTSTSRRPAARSDTPDSVGGGTVGGRRAPRPPASRRPPANTTVLRPSGQLVDGGAGVVLAFLFWGWVGLPFLRGGPAEVKKMLRAKWLNQAPDGTWLP